MHNLKPFCITVWQNELSSQETNNKIKSSAVAFQRYAKLRWLACQTSPLIVLVLRHRLHYSYKDKLSFADNHEWPGVKLWLNFNFYIGMKGSRRPSSVGPCSLTSRWLVWFTEGFPSPTAGLLVSRVLPSSWPVTFLPFLNYLPFA